MRTTLTIDDDVLIAARHLAEHQGRNVGEVVSALAREGLTRSQGKARAERNGIPLLSKRAGTVPVTLDLVNQLRDERA